MNGSLEQNMDVEGERQSKPGGRAQNLPEKGTKSCERSQLISFAKRRPKISYRVLSLPVFST
jgi:hypothetical protein